MMFSHRSSLVWLLLLVATCLSGCCVAAQEDAANSAAAVCDCTEECNQLADARVQESQAKCQQRIDASCQEERQQHAKEIETMELVLEEAKENAKASLERANSLREEEHAACQQAQDELAAVKARVEKLTLAENEVEELKRQVATLSKDKSSLEETKELLTRDLDDTTQKLRKTNDKYLESSQTLLKAQEQYRELFDKYSTTHINFKLMRDDVVKMAHNLKMKVEAFWNQHCAPYWDMIAKPLAPWIKFVISIVGPVTNSVVTLIVDLFRQQVVPFWKQHVVPFWKQHVYPKIEPTLAPLFEKHDEALASLSAFVQEKSHAAYSYVKLLEGREDSAIRKALLEALQFGDEHSDKVVRIAENMLLLFIGFWIFAGLFAWRRHRKRKRAQSAQTNGGGAGLSYPNISRKKNQ